MSERDLRRKLAWAIAIRLAIGTVLLGSAVLVDDTAGARSAPLFYLIGVVYLLGLIDALSLKFVARYRWLIDLQLAGDALVVSAFIYITGGVNSYYASLYVLPIIAAAMFQSRRGALMLAVFSTLIYVGLVTGQYLGERGLLADIWTPPHGVLPSFAVARYAVAINVFGFFAVAWLSGSLAEGLRRADVRLARASNEIADLQAFNEHVIDSLTSGLVTTDARGRVLTCNRTAQTIMGLVDQVVGRPLREVLRLPADLADAVESQLDTTDPLPILRADYPSRLSDGQLKEIGVAATRMHTPGGHTGLLVTFQDITDFKKLERDAQMRQRLAAVGEMAAGIAHEIRNPLASMSGSIQILRRELPLSTEQAQLMDIVLRESERLNETIRSFLAYARPQRFQIAPLDLRRLLTDTAMLLRNSSEVKPGHAVEVDTPGGAVPYEADENQMRQIVWNLATNGLRAMEGGGRLRLSAHLERATAFDHTVVLEVQDEGVGMDAEQLDGIFQPFHTRFAKGSGLGLAIVHRIVSDYSGDVSVSSIPGQGTTVTVRLPAQAVAATA